MTTVPEIKKQQLTTQESLFRAAQSLEDANQAPSNDPGAFFLPCIRPFEDVCSRSNTTWTPSAGRRARA